VSSMREIKNRINATEKTSQITKAMHMVSAAKLKKAERSIAAYRPLTKRLSRVLARVLSSDRELSHSMLEGRDVEKTVYIIVSSDRGLAGPFNNNVFKAFENYINKQHDSNDEFVVAALGFKAFSFAKRKKYTLIHDKVIQVRDDIQFLDFREITDTFIKGFLSGAYDKVVAFYTQYVNTLTQNVKQQTLIPLMDNPLLSLKEDNDFEDKKEKGKFTTIYHYEPSASSVLQELLPMYVVNLLYGMILEAKASEHASRMTAMKSATDNAKDLIRDLQLHYNRARQDAITIELTDIIGGAEAVN